MTRICWLKNAGILAAATLGVLLATSPAMADPASEVHFRRALQYQFAGNTDAAMAEYRKGLEIDPGSVDGHAKLGALLLDEQGDVDSAISELMTALTIDPSCQFCQRTLDEAVDRRNGTAADNIARGNDFYRAGNLNRAAAAYRVGVYISPENSDAHNSLAWTLYRQGRLEDALASVNEALRLKPDDPEYVNTLACVLYDQGKVDNALSMWRKAISKSKKANAADLYGLAIGYLSKGDSNQAAQNFREAIKSDPNYKNAIYLRNQIGMSVRALATHDRLMTLLGDEEQTKKESSSDNRH